MRRTRIALAGLIVLAFALRLGHLLAIRHDVLFDHPVLDEEVYVGRALAMLHGESGTAPFWQPPGIVYALAGIFALFGRNLFWARLVQALVATACVPLAFVLGKRLRSPAVGLAAAALVALEGVLIFEAGELLPATWIACFDLLALVLLLEARERRDWRWAAACGLALGAATVFSPLILVFVPLAAVALARSTGGRARTLMLAALLVGTALPIAPVTWRNWRSGGELVLVSSNGGLNFYLGNNAAYHDTFTLRPGRHWDELNQEPDRHGVTTAAGRSSYFYGQGFAFARAHPLDAAGLYARKLYLFFHGAEIPRDSDLYDARLVSPVLRVLVGPRPLWFPGALLMPLALLGACVLDRRRWGPVVALFASQVIVISAFFVTSRHRAPMLPVACVLAACGAAWLIERARRASAAGRAAIGGGLAAAVVLASLPLWETRFSLRGEVAFSRGLVCAQILRDPGAAVGHYRAAIALDGNDPRFWFELGNTEDQRGRLDEAVKAWSHAAELDSWDVRPRRRAALASMRAGDLDGAAHQLQANLDAASRPARDYAYEHFSLGVIDVKAGRYAPALEKLTRAARLDGGYFRTNAEGFARSLLDAHAAPDAQFWTGFGAMLASAGDAATSQAALAYARDLGHPK